MLASQIYRAKGGIPYAKEYFSRAKDLLEKKLAENPNADDVELKYAIICYSGDVRYWPEYKTYKHEAESCADKIIDENGSIATEKLETAMAYLIKGNGKRAEELIRGVAEINNTAKFWHKLYLDTVNQGQWIWPSNAPDRDFLLYYVISGN